MVWFNSCPIIVHSTVISIHVGKNGSVLKCTDVLLHTYLCLAFGTIRFALIFVLAKYIS